MIDSEGLYFETERELARDFGKEVKDETLWRMMGRKPIEAMAVYIKDLDIDITPIELLKIRDSRFEKKLRENVIPMTGLFEILREFKGKLKLAIATGSPEKFLEIALEGLNIKDFFDVLQNSDDVINGKPDPEIYLKTIRQLNLKPKECIVLEDSGNGALAGNKAGCYTIAIP